MMDWSVFAKEISKLVEKVNCTPDIVIGIVRGGVVPAGVIADSLNVKDMYCLMVKRDGAERKLKSEIMEDIQGKKILLVEDSLESGRSLMLAANYLRKKGALVKTACLYTMPMTEIVPDYFINQVKKLPKFPWER